ncbi:MAG: EscV/YscV/HrcV family type III secretion system export apparatus protein, partial [Methylocystis sp.]|nr:EscV/YscV/HrcV family type III secretion system export apparatus protein [Methylocystis sp.]
GFDADPSIIEKFGAEASAAIRERLDRGEVFAVLTTPEARPYVRLIMSRLFPSLSVLSHLEITSGAQLNLLGSIS